jgi:hypothetical protein
MFTFHKQFFQLLELLELIMKHVHIVALFFIWAVRFVRNFAKIA